MRAEGTVSWLRGSLLALGLVGLAACWADFPESRIRDGSVGGVDGPNGGADGAVSEGQGGCGDRDRDGHDRCAGDCNDDDGKVRPNQTAYFIIASAGSFDFNCDGKVEPEHPDESTGCELVGSECRGGGWEGSVPGCGESGKLITCEQRSKGCADRSADQRQGCR